MSKTNINSSRLSTKSTDNNLGATISSNIQKNIDILYAGALGDAFGYPIEFKSYSKILDFNRGEELTHFIKNPQGKIVVSDDTQMTLFTLQAALDILGKKIKTGENPTAETFTETVIQNYVEWYETQQQNYDSSDVGLLHFEEMHKNRAPGNTCLAALFSLKQGMPAFNYHHHLNNSKGCGGIMRVAPLLFLKPVLNQEELFEYGCLSALTTHGHPFGYLPSGAMIFLLDQLNEGVTLIQSYDNLIDFLQDKKHPGVAEFSQYLKDKKQYALKSMSVEEMTKHLGGGWTGEEALMIAIYSAHNAKQFQEAIQIGANHSGDSDSTASLAAQLFVAQHGLPQSARNDIELLDVSAPIKYLHEKTNKIFTLMAEQNKSSELKSASRGFNKKI